MTWQIFLLVLLGCALPILVFRVVPLFVLKGRELSPKNQRALSLIPPAAFAALVANDLFSADMFDEGILAGVLPLVAAAIVLVVALWTKNLLASALTGVVSISVVHFVLSI